VRQEHDEHHQGQFDDGRRGVGEEALFEVLDERCLQDQMKVWRLQTHKSTQQIQCLNAVALLHEEIVESQK
jgi:hypothetical protein